MSSNKGARRKASRKAKLRRRYLNVKGLLKQIVRNKQRIRLRTHRNGGC